MLVQSLKTQHPDARVCLITDQPDANPVFDYVHLLPAVSDNAYANDAAVFKLTPFRETIKLEADMIIPRNIEHWWDILNVNDDTALDKILNIQPKTYKYKDVLNRGTKRVYFYITTNS